MIAAHVAVFYIVMSPIVSKPWFRLLIRHIKKMPLLFLAQSAATFALAASFVGELRSDWIYAQYMGLESLSFPAFIFLYLVGLTFLLSLILIISIVIGRLLINLLSKV